MRARAAALSFGFSYPAPSVRLVGSLTGRRKDPRMAAVVSSHHANVERSSFLGFLNDYPDYVTQGASKDELIANLKDLLVDLESGEVPYVRKVEELLVTE